MVNDELDGDPTESFSFKLSKALRERLGAAARNHRCTVGREVVVRLIASFEDGVVDEPADVVASPQAKSALTLATALEAKVAALEARIAALEQRA